MAQAIIGIIPTRLRLLPPILNLSWVLLVDTMIRLMGIKNLFMVVQAALLLALVIFVWN